MVRKPRQPLAAPSVPMSVYRGLLTQLDDAQARLDDLSSDNQQLQHQNQILKHEIRKLSLQLTRTQQDRATVPTKSLPPETSVVARVPETTKSAGRPKRPIVKIEPEFIDLEDEGWEDERGLNLPGWLFWMLALTVASIAGVATFTLVRSLVGTGF